MNTKYPLGLYRLYDSDYADRNCAVINTDLTGHLVTLYTSRRTSTYDSVYGKVISASGSMPTPFLIPDVTDNAQKDASITAVKGTDDFVTVWSSNAVASTYRIYLRRFRVAANGIVTPVMSAIQISQENGHYVAPRIIYNPVLDLYFAIWISVKDKQVQFKYFSYDEESNTFSDASYEGILNDNILSDYFNSSLDICNNKSMSIVLFNTGNRIIAGFNKSANQVGLYQFSAPSAGSIPQVNLPIYEVTDIQRFWGIYDEEINNIKLVYHRSNDDHIYGVNISYFADQLYSGSPVVLNQSSETCRNPFIQSTPYMVDSGGKKYKYYYAAWETGKNGGGVNYFDSSFIAFGFEQEINSGVSSTYKPLIAISDNQSAVIVDASAIGNESLGDSKGILIHVENRN